ncbi:MAG: glycosyltransferase N-terminal domain-containing protein [Bergeyella sp.]
MSLFNDKIKCGLEGRKHSLEIVKSKISPNDKVIWMHSASLGEYEQGVPVLEKLKEKYPDYKILITFFSPSGYENVAKKQTIADAVCYLPFDKKSQIKEFVSNFKTDIFFTVKYDYWYHLLDELKSQGAKIYVISALFYKNQVFFKPYGKWIINQLKKNVDWFFHQTKNSEELAKKARLVHSSVSGDTRFDRVRQNLVRDNFVEYIEEFKQNKTTIIFGSSWEAEERIAEILAHKHPEIKIIIAPHDLKRVPHLQELFPKSVLYSQFFDPSTPQLLNSSILIIDSIGLLSKLYSYGNLAVVGGGFHSAGLHNILESAVFGIPVFFGNRYRKNPEADSLIEAKGGKSFEDEYFASKYISEILKNPDIMEAMGENAKQLILSQPDSAEMIVEKIVSGLKP